MLDRDGAITSPSLPRAYPLVPSRASGSVIEDPDGNLFLDFNAGIAVNSTGHCHPRVVEAVRAQAQELLHYSASDFYLPIYSQMCEALAETLPISGQKRVFFTNSGAEAVEGSIKLARYATGRPYVISFFGAFHGRTYGAVSLTASKSKYHTGFGPLLPGVFHAPYAFSERDPETGARTHDEDATFDYLENVLFRYEVSPTEVAAIFLEPVQGEGGYIVPPASWVQRLRALCDQHGILLVADEVQSGMGRTGKMWAIELADVEPDIIISAKGIASGLPLGAFAAKAELMERWGAGAHGSTYGGSPVACAAGIATLETIQARGPARQRQQDRRRAAHRSRASCAAKFPRFVTDVRGTGLMIGVEFDTGDHAAAVQQRAFEQRPARPRVRREHHPDVAPARGDAGPGATPRCRSSVTRWPRSRSEPNARLLPRRRPLPVAARGSGAEIFDTDGRRYLDGSGGAIVVGIGHGVHRGARRDRQAGLVDRLRPRQCLHLRRRSRRTPTSWRRCCRWTAPRLFPVSGGSEAVETALKMARAYHLARGEDRHVVIGRQGAYHGNTLATLDVGGRASLRAPYEPWLGRALHTTTPYEYRCPFPDTHPDGCGRAACRRARPADRALGPGPGRGVHRRACRRCRAGRLRAAGRLLAGHPGRCAASTVCC